VNAKRITEIRLLPPLAISRLGNSPEPVNNYDLIVPKDQPLGYRQIVPAPTLIIDESSGRIVARETRPVTFKDEQGRIRPVAPFLELWATSGDDKWEHLTSSMLEGAELRWRVRVANIKVFRRTGDPRDRVEADSGWFNDHSRRVLHGVSQNFLPHKTIPLGHIQFIDPSDEFPHIRARFTPAHGYVYGSSPFVINADGSYNPDPAFGGNYIQHDTNIRDVVYDMSKGTWLGYDEVFPPNQPNPPEATIPGQIFAGQANANIAGSWVSRGYLDDECDGTVEVELTIGKKTLSTFARIGAGPPAFAPDSFPIRTVYDELEQALLGPDIALGDYSAEELQEEAEEIIRRAFETIRLMNTTIMNGNAFRGQVDIGSTMVRQDRNDAERVFEPIMAPTIVDNLAVRTLHQNIFTTLRSGAPPWFMSVLRKFDEIGDLTDLGRRKMPGLMRNADGRYLCLTRRQREKIRLAATESVAPATTAAKVKPKNQTARQLLHRADGAPPSTLPNSAISNCFPGLEFDFRNVWRRIFVGIVMHEADSYVVDVEDQHLKSLLHCRILKVDGNDMTTILRGPRQEGGPAVDLFTPANPDAAWFMEWSNSLSRVLTKAGSTVTCVFTAKPSTVQRRPNWDDTQTVELEIRRFFEPDSPAISRQLVEPGDLTQSLCSPWQNDYRECACYYWASSRPDFVDVVDDSRGLSAGYNWMDHNRNPDAPNDDRVYLPDPRPRTPTDPTWITYDQLFQEWQSVLQFIVGGNDQGKEPTGG